jgi:hypothetical protein
MIVDEVFKICKPVWIEGFLYYSMSKKAIDYNIFFDELFLLSQMFYYPMMLNHLFYLYVMRKDDFNVTESLKKCLNYLSGYVYASNYSLWVVMNLLVEINKEKLTALKKQIIFDSVLDSFFYKRTERVSFLKAIKDYIYRYESNLIFNDRALSNFINDYEKRKIII